jgi:hypothetical protein
LFPSVDFLEMCMVTSCVAYMLLSMARWVFVFVRPCKTVVQMLLLDSFPRRLRLFCLFLFLLASLMVVDSTAFCFVIGFVPTVFQVTLDFFNAIVVSLYP